MPLLIHLWEEPLYTVGVLIFCGVGLYVLSALGILKPKPPDKP